MKTLLQPQNLLPALLLLALAAVPTVATSLGDDFLVAFFARVLIYGIAASALNIALGFGGLVSLGHALFLGIGMYAVALPVHHGITSGWAHLAIAVVTCALVGGVTGLVSLRTTGIGFIMITLAFAQMGYFVVVSLKQYGGDDGLGISAPSDFGAWRLGSATTVFYTAWVVLALMTWWIWRLRSSPFGMTLRAGRQNARRVASIGLPLNRYQLTAYVLSAVLCGVAGVLTANLNAYASPSTMSWIISGDLIVMVVLGGIGSVFGPLLGALAFLGLEEVLKPVTEHWMALFGLAITAMTLLGTTGIVGLLARLRPRRSAQPAVSVAAGKEVTP